MNSHWNIWINLKYIYLLLLLLIYYGLYQGSKKTFFYLLLVYTKLLTIFIKYVITQCNGKRNIAWNFEFNLCIN